jgi:hypothetical protein
MPWVNPNLSREHWIVLGILFLVNLLTIAGRSIYLHTLPVWIYILNFALLGVAIFFSIIDARKKKEHKKRSPETE